MIDAFGGMSAGLGLFFAGMWLLSENLKDLASYRFRLLVTNYIPNRLAAFGWGVLAGGATQSMTALTFISGSIRQSGLVSTDRSCSIVLGGNIGTSLLVAVVVFDIELVALYGLGLAGMAMASGWVGRYRSYATLLFGLAAVIVGLVLAKESMAPLADRFWVDEMKGWMSQSLWFAFAGAAVLAFVLQAVMLVVILGIGMTAVGVLSVDQLLMVAYGSWAGSSVLLLALSANLTGAVRQVAAFQILMNVVSLAIFMPMLFLEIHFGIPLLKAAVLAMDATLAEQMGAFIILTNVIPAVLLFLVLGPTVRLFEDIWPVSRLERLSQTRYIHGRAFGDPEMALKLAELEQHRVLSALREHFDAAREDKVNAELTRASEALISRIGEFVEEAEARHSGAWTEGFSWISGRQRILVWLNEQIADLCKALKSVSDGSDLARLKTSVIEGIDAVLLVIVQEATSDAGAANPRPYTAQIVGRRGSLMRNIRETYLEDGARLSGEERSSLLRITNTVELVFFLLTEFTRQTGQREAA